MSNIAATKTASDNLAQLGKSLSQKLGVALTEQSTVKTRLNQETANYAAIEKKHILDEATDAELLEARQIHADIAAQVEAIDRRIVLIRETIAENDLKIAAADQNLKIARRDYCVQISNEKLEKIRENKQFRDLLLEAMAAYAANGAYHWTFSAHRFAEQHFTKILPNITETEAREAAEKFKKMNDLED